ncbi:HD domain-containing protein [Lysinibacillus agricola]|uniref:HD domain-containing protein n=1 Tax=Lysinibacillus agricola TaxID=2590012 RepID=UPI003C13AFAA
MNNVEFETKLQNAYDSVVFIKNKHGNQTRIGGEPYHTHPLSVGEILCNKGYASDMYFLTGLFHDLLEDTDATEDEILQFGGEQVLEAVKLLTKSEGYIMNEYIENIKNNEIAKVVKLADRLHNLQCAKVANNKFKDRYIKETEEYYIDLAKGTCFESDITNALNELKSK